MQQQARNAFPHLFATLMSKRKIQSGMQLHSFQSILQHTLCEA